MSNNIYNEEHIEEELSESSKSFEIPYWLRILSGIISISLFISCLILYAKYIANPENSASPDSLGLSAVLIFSLSFLFFVAFPWRKFGIRIKKIGAIEFEEIVSTQATEHAEEMSYLQDRIDSLEASLRRLDDTTQIQESFQEHGLKELLLDFLEKFDRWAFSPSRIKVWGSKQEGFDSFKNYPHPFIRNTLQKLVAEGKLETRISKKGNTLYRISRKGMP